MANAIEPIVYRRAWTGGSRPGSFWQSSRQERDYTRRLFREQVEIDCGRDWFFSTPFGVLDYARILWNRARYDAHATLVQPNEQRKD